MPTEKNTVLFVCQYGGAKSVIAASYFNRLAEEQRLPFVAIAASAEQPYEAVPPPVVTFLAAEGLDVSAFKPRRVEAAEVRAASRVVSIDCNLANEDLGAASVEKWDDVPQASVALQESVAAIRRHVEELAAELNRK